MEKLDSITIGSMALSTILSALLTLLVCLLGLKILMGWSIRCWQKPPNWTAR